MPVKHKKQILGKKERRNEITRLVSFGKQMKTRITIPESRGYPSKQKKSILDIDFKAFLLLVQFNTVTLLGCYH